MIDVRRGRCPHRPARQTQRFPPSRQASTGAERIAALDAEGMRRQGRISQRRVRVAERDRYNQHLSREKDSKTMGFGGVLFSLSFAEERKGAAGGKCSGRTESSAPTKCSKNPCKAGWDEKNKIVPGVLPRTMPKHRDTTLLRRLLTQVGLMKCRYTSALLRAPPSEPKAQVPSTRRLRSHVPPSVPRPLSPGRALFGGLKWGTLSFIATLKSYRKISLRFSDKRF